ncbi:MAG: alpha/beta fold hydrolase, partial [Janthinobacterium lividum]
RLDVLVADVLALADLFGADRFRLVGHDWGAIVAWAVGANHPERLERLVVMDGPHPDLWATQAINHPTQALRSTYVALFQLPWLPEAALGALDFAGLRAMIQKSARADTFDPGAIEYYTDAWGHPGSLTGMLNYYRALRERPSPQEPARITPPTLILWGENDVFLERHVAEAACDLCDNGRLVVVPGATHWLHLDEPAQVNAELIEFLT